LDVSDESIKVMQLEGKRNDLFPTAYSDLPLPPGIIVNHIIGKEDKLTEYIKRAVDNARNVNTKYVVANVPEAKSFVRVLKLPVLSETETDGAIPYELEQDIPVPIDQVYLDWQLIKKDQDSQHVLVTAAPKDYIDTLISVIMDAGLKPVALELESQATARAIIGPEDSKQANLILDMSVMQTNFIITVLEGILEYTSSIPVAGNSFTESIARTLGVSNTEAEKIKKEVGLLGDSKKGNVRQALLPILDNVVDEIKNVIRYYDEHSIFKDTISKVYLSGGTAKLAGLVDYISARLNLGSGKPLSRVVLGNPWVNVCDRKNQPKIPISKEDSLGYSTAIGLAIRGANHENN
jgi:type IV pilus assembly protein PilM